MPRVAIALGSNLGKRESNIAAAVEELRQIASVGEPFLIASLHDTEPQDCPPDSPRFLNTAVDFHFSGIDPLKLLEQTQAIEKKLGREPHTLRNAPRLIDIDIVLFGNVTLDHPELQLPHPRIYERPFVLNPLREIRNDI
jgi:2-amino-4-hydroxy-6-hydroxymethyldihydropteridine diphosphokinase